MNSKNRLIQKLLSVAKKHKVLTYPVLALIAIVSVFSYFFNWSTGAGKRVVAVVMVLLMIVSQSYFLTSSATEVVDDEAAVLAQQELQEDNQTEREDVLEEEVINDSASVENAVEDNSNSDVYADEPVTSTESEDVYTEDEDVFDEDMDSKLAAASFDCNFYYTAYEDNGGSAGTRLGPHYTLTRDPIGTSGDGAPIYNLSDVISQANGAMSSYSNNGCYSFSTTWYTTAECTTPVDPSNVVAVFEQGNYLVKLYCKTTIEAYEIHVANKDENDTSSEPINNVVCDPAGGIVAKDGSITISADRNGYELSYASIKNYAVTYAASNGSVTVNIADIADNSIVKDVVLHWTPKVYTIQYYRDDTGSIPGDTQSYTYDDASATFAVGTFTAPPAGYKTSGWMSMTNSYIADVSAKIQTVQSSLITLADGTGTIELKPKFSYKGLEAVDSSLQADMYYKSAFNAKTYAAKYVDDTNTDTSGLVYNYTISGPVSSSNDLLSTYGVTVSKEDGQGVTIASTEPKKTTGGTPININVTVTDPAAPAEWSPLTFTVKIYIHPKSISIKAPESKYTEKQYDGTTLVNSLLNGVTGLQTTADDENVTVQFTSAHYDDKAAGEREIILEGAQLKVGDGGDPSLAANYSLTNMRADSTSASIAGTITKRMIYIDATPVLGTAGYVRTGEKTPDYNVTIHDLAGTGLIAPDTEAILDGIDFITNRTDNNVAGRYGVTKINATAENIAGQNYNIMVYDPSTTYFDVKQDTPGTDSYTITPSVKQTGEWYSKVALIKASGYYDSVYVYSGDTVLASGEEGNYAELTEDALKNAGSVSIQLKKKETGAFTSKIPLNIKVDGKAPTYKGYSVSIGSNVLHEDYVDNMGGSSPGSGALYFPGDGKFLTFGNYFNKVIKVTVRYKDESSGPAKLYYSMFGGTEQTTTFSAAADGYATASFEVVKNMLGEIHFHAEDLAGNEETPERILSHNTVDQWEIEDAGPGYEFTVVDAKKNTVPNGLNATSEYYSNCTAYISAADGDAGSGIYGITWHIKQDGVELDPVTELVGGTKAYMSKDFAYEIKGHNNGTSGTYVIWAEIEDNAANVTTTETYSFKVDNDVPGFDIDDSKYQDWMTEAVVDFDTWDDISGINTINIYDSKGVLRQSYVPNPDENNRYHCTFETDSNDTYRILVTDKAGNETEKKVKLEHVSSSIPDCPVVTMTPDQDVETGWYNSMTGMPTITVNKVSNIDGGTTPVETKYNLKFKDETSFTTAVLKNAKEDIAISEDGIYEMGVWAESASGIKCLDDSHTNFEFKVDTTEPDVTYSVQSVGNGSSVVVTYTVTDAVSGVNPDSIKVLCGVKMIESTVEETENGYEGSFVIKEVGDYTIVASDIAGNRMTNPAFTPMSMNVNAVKNITVNSAIVGANVIKGTSEIDNIAIAYRKVAEEEYTELSDVIVTDVPNGKNASIELTDLAEATSYVYKVTAVSALGEVLTYEGYFRTLSSNQTGINLKGIARYADNRQDGAIIVGVFDGNECIMATEVVPGKQFMFNNVPDGNYNIVATDGEYSTTMRVLIDQGYVIYPDSAIELVLSGKNTAVVIETPETPNITAGNMNSLFDDDANYTEDDKALVESGQGTVEFKLYANLMPVAIVSPNEISAMYAVTDNDKVVGAYLDLSIKKFITKANGEVEVEDVHELEYNLSITIPLGQLAGKPGLEVVRIHDSNGNYVGKSLPDQDSSASTYTISTNRFSTYAILYSLGDANNSTEEPTTQNPTIENGTAAPSTNGQIVSPGTQTPSTEVDSDDAPDKDDKDKDKDNNKPGGSSVGSLTSSGSAKTGDASPVMMIEFVMLLSAIGCVVLRKKHHES